MRLMLGLATMVALSIVLGIFSGFLVSASTAPDQDWLQIGTNLVGFGSAFCGGYIARRRFIPLAIGTYSVFWLLAFYHLNSFSQGLTLVEIFTLNLAALALSLTSVTFGSLLGQIMARPGKVTRAAA